MTSASMRTYGNELKETVSPLLLIFPYMSHILLAKLLTPIRLRMPQNFVRHTRLNLSIASFWMFEPV